MSNKIIPRNHWIDRHSKVVLQHVEVRVANPGVEYVNSDIVITISPVNFVQETKILVLDFFFFFFFEGHAISIKIHHTFW